MSEAEQLLPVSSKNDVIRDIDDAIDEIGFGKTQAFLFSAMGLSYMADAMEVTLLSFLYSCLVDFWDLSDYQGDLIVSCVFAGELIGALLAGPLADKFGRRVVSIGSTFLCGVAGMCSALADNVLIFILFRTLTGVGIGMFCVPFDLVGEFMPSSSRGLILSIYQYWWCVGSMYTVLMAWLVLPSWRALVILCAAPVLLAGVCMVFIPESPRWLLAQGRNEEAERIITDMAKRNWPQKALPNIHLERSLLKEGHGDLGSLFENPELRRYTMANMVIWGSAGFTFYGVQLLLTRVFATTDDDDTCSFDYSFLLIVYSTEIIGTIALMFTIETWGRRYTQLVWYIVAGVSVFILGFSSLSNDESLIVGCFGLSSIMAAFSGSWVATPEVYETENRATGHALVNAVARVGAFCSSYWVDSSNDTVKVGILLGVMNVMAGVFALVLPETKGMKIG